MLLPNNVWSKINETVNFKKCHKIACTLVKHESFPANKYETFRLPHLTAMPAAQVVINFISQCYCHIHESKIRQSPEREKPECNKSAGNCQLNIHIMSSAQYSSGAEWVGPGPGFTHPGISGPSVRSTLEFKEYILMLKIFLAFEVSYLHLP